MLSEEQKCAVRMFNHLLFINNFILGRLKSINFYLYKIVIIQYELAYFWFSFPYNNGFKCVLW